MFSWISIHEETARKLFESKDDGGELIRVIALMKSKGLPTTKLEDLAADGKEVQLKEMDPFTFLANFNRGANDTKRQAMWGILKDEWDLKSEVPGDFDGVPLANAQSSWFMPYEKERPTDHVPTLWRFFRHVMDAETESLDTDLMDSCLVLKQIGMTNLTMGMFWACPRIWVSTDGKNIAFAETKGLSAIGVRFLILTFNWGL